MPNTPSSRCLYSDAKCWAGLAGYSGLVNWAGDGPLLLVSLCWGKYCWQSLFSQVREWPRRIDSWAALRHYEKRAQIMSSIPMINTLKWPAKKPMKRIWYFLDLRLYSHEDCIFFASKNHPSSHLFFPPPPVYMYVCAFDIYGNPESFTGSKQSSVNAD